MKQLYASGEDYLKALFILIQKKGIVRSFELAQYMGYSKASISHAVTNLQNGGFLFVDSDKCLHLTDIGTEIASKIHERHCFFAELLIVVGVDPAIAEKEACQLEHDISQESFERIQNAFSQKNECCEKCPMLRKTQK